MKEYTFWYSATYTYKAGFRAESKEHAEMLLKGVFENYNSIEDLPGFWEKDKGYDADYSPETLEEWAD